MTEYDYSPEAVANYISTQASVEKWTRDPAVKRTALTPNFERPARSKALAKVSPAYQHGFSGHSQNDGNFSPFNNGGKNLDLITTSMLPTITTATTTTTTINSGAHSACYVAPTQVTTSYLYPVYPAVPVNQTTPRPIPSLNAIAAMTVNPRTNLFPNPTPSTTSLSTSTSAVRIQPINPGVGYTSSGAQILDVPYESTSNGHRNRSRTRSKSRPPNLDLPSTTNQFDSVRGRHPQTPYYPNSTHRKCGTEVPLEKITGCKYATWEESAYNPKNMKRLEEARAKAKAGSTPISNGASVYGYENGSVARLKYASRSSPSVDRIHNGEMLSPIPAVPALPSTIAGYQSNSSPYAHSNVSHKSRTHSSRDAHPHPSSRAPSRAASQAPSARSDIPARSSTATLPSRGACSPSSRSHGPYQYPSPYGQFVPSGTSSHDTSTVRSNTPSKEPTATYPYPLHGGRGEPELVAGSAFVFDGDTEHPVDEMGYTVEHGNGGGLGGKRDKKKASIFGKVFGRGKEKERTSTVKKRSRAGSF